MKYLLIAIGIIIYILIESVFAGIYEKKYPGSDQIIFSIVLKKVDVRLDNGDWFTFDSVSAAAESIGHSPRLKPPHENFMNNGALRARKNETSTK